MAFPRPQISQTPKRGAPAALEISTLFVRTAKKSHATPLVVVSFFSPFQLQTLQI